MGTVWKDENVPNLLERCPAWTAWPIVTNLIRTNVKLEKVCSSFLYRLRSLLVLELEINIRYTVNIDYQQSFRLLRSSRRWLTSLRDLLSIYSVCNTPLCSCWKIKTPKESGKVAIINRTRSSTTVSRWATGKFASTNCDNLRASRLSLRTVRKIPPEIIQYHRK